MNRINVLIFLLLIFTACCSAVSEGGRKVDNIFDFESCVAAGYPILKTYPAKCVAPDVGTFIQQLEQGAQINQPRKSDPLIYKPICKDLCGDGLCAEMVCQAEGCPCAENSDNCPKDCLK